MYIAELFIKWLNKNKRGHRANPNNNFKEGTGVNITADETVVPEDFDEALVCEHNYMPVDSTGTVLACTKCGFVIKQRNKNKG